MRARASEKLVLLLALLCFVALAPIHAVAQEQQQSSAAEKQPAHLGPAGELAKETREAAGEEEENGNLKHSSMVMKLAQVTGMSPHEAHMAAFAFNFALIIFLVYWLSRKSVPQVLRNRTASIQKALAEARAASQDANRRLADIEARLQKLDGEISQMQATAENEAAEEEKRIQKAAEEDSEKIVAAAKQEIEAAGKQVRRELTVLTADLAISLAKQQIRVDSGTDQALVRNFAGQLSKNGGKDGQ
jgi:F-type H+-transporting ATPase subunit b